MLMFENGNGDRVTFYSSKVSAGPQQMSFRYLQSDNVAAIRWVESGYAFVVSGNADKARLKELARAAFEQLENRAPPRRRTARRTDASKAPAPRFDQPKFLRGS